MQAYLEQFAANPWALVVGLILMAWVWEDASVICAALFAADGYITIPLAVLGAFIGICSGDLGLYYLGRLATRIRIIRAWILLNPRSRELRRRFRQKTFSNILFIRFIPGLRTVGFTLCGLWHISLRRFLLAMVSAGAIWIAIVFSLVFQLGSSVWLKGSPWKWALVGFALVLLISNNLLARRRAVVRA